MRGGHLGGKESKWKVAEFHDDRTFQQKKLAWTKARRGSLGGCSFPQR